MGSESWPQNPDVIPPPPADAFEETIDNLRSSPTEYRFYQAVRLMEAASDPSAAVGHFQEPEKEAARFRVKPSLAFPPSDVLAVDFDESPPIMTTQVLALTGPNGALPLVYTDFLEERERSKDHGPRDFLDIFHHRLLSLFYRSWLKYNLSCNRETGLPFDFSSYLASLIGIGSDRLRQRLEVDDQTLLYFTGLLALQTRSAVSLEHLLADYFGVPVEVEPMSGGWYRLSPDESCRLDEDEGESAALGFGAMVGTEYWDPNSRARIRLGPLPREKYEWFLPGATGHRELSALAEFFSRGEVDFEIQLVLARNYVPGCVLGEAGPGATQLGWTTWMKTRPDFDRDPDDTIVRLEEESLVQ